ncbi:MAG: hypothetical protein HY394_00715 [Candidatus Diapherotrites archaeon]|nr:hypothetical protein [Candidatus Diapherotrites archaeon]
MPKGRNRSGSAAERKHDRGERQARQPKKPEGPEAEEALRVRGGGKYAESQGQRRPQAAGGVPLHVAQQLLARGVPEEYHLTVFETAERESLTPAQAWEMVSAEMELSASPVWRGLSPADKREVLRRTLEGRQTGEEILAEVHGRDREAQRRQSQAAERPEPKGTQGAVVEVLRGEGFSERQIGLALAMAQQGKSDEEIFLHFRQVRAESRLRADGHSARIVEEAGRRLAEQGLRPTNENIRKILEQMQTEEMRTAAGEERSYLAREGWYAILDIAERAEGIRQKHANRLTERGVPEESLERGVDRIMGGEDETAVARDLAKRGRR